MSQGNTYKVVLVFNLNKGSADEELRRSKEASSFPNMLAKQPGFIELELVKIDDDNTMSIQTWATESDWYSALEAVKQVRREPPKGDVEENILVSRDFFGGKVIVRKSADKV